MKKWLQQKIISIVCWCFTATPTKRYPEVVSL
jgi:hypothetical protein